MKKIFIVAICTLVGLFYMQNIQAQSFTGGIKTGVVASQVAGDLSSGFNKAGFFATAYAQRQFTLKSEARVGISFVQKGSRQSDSEFKKNGLQYLMRINYVEIPLWYIYKVQNNLQLLGGFSYARLIGTPYEETNYITDVVSAGFNRNNLNIMLGLEYFVFPKIAVSIQSNNSVTPIRPHASGAKRGFNRGQYSDALLFGVSYQF